MIPEKNSLTNFYKGYLDSFYKNDTLREKLLLKNDYFGYEESLSEKEVFYNIISHYIKDAEWTLSLIRDLDINKETSLLEVGGGLGIVYGFLKKQGFNICSIEPSDLGFGDSHIISKEIFGIIDVDTSKFIDLSAEEAGKLDSKFEVIFSNNVFEHIIKLEEAVAGLKSVLSHDGLMIHNTVNYLVPYEPHFRMFLFPFYPKKTMEFIKPSLKDSELWQGINFITSSKIKKICQANALDIKFKKGVLLDIFSRLDHDKEFAQRQKIMLPIYKFLKNTGLIKLLGSIKPSWLTPMIFVCRNKIRKNP